MSGLNRLEKLYFSGNISDISSLSGLTALTTSASFVHTCNIGHLPFVRLEPTSQDLHLHAK